VYVAVKLKVTKVEYCSCKKSWEWRGWQVRWWTKQIESSDITKHTHSFETVERDVTINQPITQKPLTLNAFLNFIAYHYNIIIEIN